MKKKANFAKKNHNSLNKSPENCDFFRLIFIGTAEIYLKQTFFLQKECYSQANASWLNAQHGNHGSCRGGPGCSGSDPTRHSQKH